MFSYNMISVFKGKYMENTYNKKIPVVFASDKNCAAQMYITMLSAILNKKPDTFYDFYCLVPHKFSRFVREKFERLHKKYRNINITFVNMKNAFSNLEMQISHITSPTYYRLKIAQILPQYQKVLYLDIDTIVLDDLTELYDTDLGSNYIGGVLAAGYLIRAEKNKKYYESIGMPDMSNYINAGVILFNLELIRKDNMTEKMIDLASKNFKCMDQDILNLLFYGRIKHLNFKYNFLVAYKREFFDNPDTMKKLCDIYGEQCLDNAIKNPVIIHYATSKKPWEDKNVWLSKYWSKYQMKCPLKIKKQNFYYMKKIFCMQIKTIKSKKIMFWGASLFLKELFLKREISHNKILGIIDKDPHKHGKEFCGYKVYAPQDINRLKPDVIVFSVKNSIPKIYLETEYFVSKNCPNVKLMPYVFTKNKFQESSRVSKNYAAIQI